MANTTNYSIEGKEIIFYFVSVTFCIMLTTAKNHAENFQELIFFPHDNTNILKSIVWIICLKMYFCHCAPGSSPTPFLLLHSLQNLCIVYPSSLTFLYLLKC